MKKMNNAQQPTTSRFVAWWLTTFRGYRVDRKVLEPKQGIFCNMAYKTTWWLTCPFSKAAANCPTFTPEKE
jgi:hypothetical protein